MARRFRDPWAVGILVACRLAQNVFLAAGPSAPQRNRAPDDPRRPLANRNRSKAPAAMARSLKASANLGSHRLQGLYRPRLVLHCRLVPDLPGWQRHPASKWLDCGLAALLGGGPRQFLWRRGFRLLDLPRIVARWRGESFGRLLRVWRAASPSDSFHRE